MTCTKLLFFVALITAIPGSKSRPQPKVLIYDITEKKGEVPDIKLLSVHNLRSSPNDNQQERDSNEQDDQEDWLQQIRNSNQKVVTQQEWNNALQNILANINEQDRDSSHEQHHINDQYRSSHEQEYINQQLKESPYKSKSNWRDVSKYSQDVHGHEYDRDSTYEHQSVHKRIQNKQHKNRWGQRNQYKRRPGRAQQHRNRHIQNIQDDWENGPLQSLNSNRSPLPKSRQNNKYRQGSDDLPYSKKSIIPNYGKSRDDNQQSRYRSRNSNRNNKRSQRGSSKINYFATDYADTDLEEIEGHRVNLPSSNSLLPELIGANLNVPRNKREAERQSIIQNLKSLVRKLQSLDDNNVAELYGTAKIGQVGSFKVDIDKLV